MKRLKREIENLDIPDADAEAVDGNLFHWKLAIFGPEGTPYFGGTFLVDINFPNEYPFDPPKVHFITKIYHPNIDDKGSICMSVLKDNWLPSITAEILIGYLKDLLKEPNPNDPLMPEIAKLFIENNVKYIENARECTKKYAL